MVELGNGLLLALLVLAEFPEGFHSLPSGNVFAVEGVALPTPADHSLLLRLVRFALHAALIESLLVATVIDFQWMIIPDGSTVPVMLLALVTSAAAGGIWLVPLWYEGTQLLAILRFQDEFDGGIRIPELLVQHPHIHGFLVSVVGLIVGGGLVWAVRWIGHWALGREAMGFGDVVLMAMIGAVVGWQPVVTIFFLAPACAIVVVLVAVITGAYREFPFGPWLSLATVLLLIGWQAIWPYAGGFFLAGRIIPFVGIGMLILLAFLLKLMRLIRGDRYWLETDANPWTSADQLHYLSQENAGFRRNMLSSENGLAGWGSRSAGGSIGERRWRSHPLSHARQWMQRKP
jgi:leader peptidase (prepilin peptidase)/N-methyltransferase